VTAPDVAAGPAAPLVVAAVTVKRYAVPLVRPVTIAQSFGTFAVTCWPEDEVTV
jgi:hypothetical protein